jgi:beta-galactosidase
MEIATWYYPKTWPRDDWDRDLDRIADAGIDTLRTGVFYWSRVEPRRGEFDFDWLDDALDAYADRGIDAVLGTPTATPPKWLVDEHRDILQEDIDGTVRDFGSRRHYCFNSPTYRAETERIVERVAERYADHPAVVGWQVDNEFGCHGTVRCYCDDCTGAFRDWLRATYGDIETLNERWGTEFWSQRLNGFDAVEVPRPTLTFQHPTRMLDFYRFASESVAEYNRLQADVLRTANEDWFVTTNFMGDFDDLDPTGLVDDLDLVTWNSYPSIYAQRAGSGADAPGDRDPAELDLTEPDLRAGNPAQIAMNHDWYRGLGDAPFWIMEQQAGETVAATYAPEPGQGAIRLWAHHAAAHGADVVTYFRYRRELEGQEQYWSGLVERDGTPDRGFAEARQAADELDALPGDGLDTPDASVAVLHDIENLWGLDIQPQAPDFDYWGHLRAYYGALKRFGLQVDLVPPDAALDDYAAVVAPTMYLLDESTADRLDRYVADGGELLVTIRSGEKTPDNQLREAKSPGPLSPTVGTVVDQHESVPPVAAPTIRYDGTAYECGRWVEWLDPDDATAVATHASGPADGTAAITRNARGDGHATYVGIWPDDDLALDLVDVLLDRAGVERCPRLPERVQVAHRDGLTWVTNFDDRPVSIDAPADATWHLGDATLGSYGVAVLDAPPSAVSVST